MRRYSIRFIFSRYLSLKGHWMYQTMVSFVIYFGQTQMRYMYLWNILLKYLICFYTGWAFKGQCYYTIITIMPDSIVKYCRTSLVGEKMTEVCLLPLVEISLRSFWRSTISVLLLELTRYWLYMHFKYEVPLVYLLNE